MRSRGRSLNLLTSSCASWRAIPLKLHFFPWKRSSSSFPRSPLPWLHIAEEVGKEAKRRGFKKLGLTGTKFLVSGPVYPQKLEQMGIGYLRPATERQEHINDIIFDELVRGQQTSEALKYL